MDEVVKVVGDGKMSSKLLEEVAGFLNHVSRAYPTIKLYLNGVYASLNSWRPDRDEEGWKIPVPEFEYIDNSTPSRVKMVNRMKFDVFALEELTKQEKPPERFLRPEKQGAIAFYEFGDASGSGFGTSEWNSRENEVHAEFGTWDKSVADNSSSNFRELANIVVKIERMFAEGKINEKTEVFLCSQITPMRNLPSTVEPQNRLRWYS